MATLSQASGSPDHGRSTGIAARIRRTRLRLLLALRITIIVVGGYFLMSGFAALLGLFLHTMALNISDAMLWSAMLGFILYIPLIMWAFAAPPRHHPATVILTLALGTCAFAAYLTPTSMPA